MTESVFVRDEQRALVVLDELEQLGVQLEFDDLTRLIGERDEHGRGHRSAAGVRPAQQSLDPGHPTIDGVGDRLIVKVQFGTIDRASDASRQAGSLPGEVQLTQVKDLTGSTAASF